MDLRDKPGIPQRIAEAVIRFRLVLILLLTVAWVLVSASWGSFIAQMLASAQQNEAMLFNLIRGEIPLQTLLLGPLFAVLLLTLVRGYFFGWKQGLFWLGGVAAVMGVLPLLEGSESVLAFVVMAVLAIAVTLLFFVRSLVAVTLLPILLLGYGLSTWVLALGVTPVGWQGLLALFLADTAAMLIGVGMDLRAGRPVTGALSGNVSRQLPVLWASVGALIVSEVFFAYLGAPALVGRPLLLAIAIIVSYAVWMMGLFAPVLSLMPMQRLRSEKRSMIGKR